jgi:chorismate mutase/prephenate dehydratase
MAKDTPQNASKKPSENGLRSQLERLDRELVKQLGVRAKVAAQLLASPSPDGQYERALLEDDALLARAVEANKGPWPADTLRAVFREILSGSRALAHKRRVAFLGPAYSYSHVAALHRFGAGVDQAPVGSIAAVFEEVNRGHAEFGLVPLENSTDGRIADTLDMFTRLRVQVCGEVQLRIHHNLLGKCSRADVTEVYSRPQALSQCRNWLSKHMPLARPIEVTSTSTAAQLAQTKQGAAAIASVQAGVHYGLEVLAGNIEDNAANITRFAVIGDRAAARTGRDKTAIMFEVPDRPGSLADAMTIFKRNKLNLSWIESFPIARSDGGYLFFVEMDGHETDAKVRRALTMLERRAIRLQTLGSYPRSEVID